MSEYWVSKKKYFCKYCEIYIADDAPSRQQHENGLRHKGNVERFIRGIYKSGEKQKKDLEEEKREMARVEQAANAAFAQDIGAGRAKPVAPVASTSSTAQRAAPKPSNPYANYSTAESLGYSDPDTERLAAELKLHRSQGLAGEWQILTSPPPVDLSAPSEDVKSDTTSGTLSAEKRLADAPPEEDPRSFKLRKKTLGIGLGEVYDPGLIPVRLKKKEEPETSTVTTATPSSQLGKERQQELPKWTTLQWKRPGDDARPRGTADSTAASEGPESITSRKVEDPPSLQSPSESVQGPTAKWTKVEWNTAVANHSQYSSLGIAESEAKPAKQEITQQVPSVPTEHSTGSLFKKRKAPTNGGRGRRPL